MRLTTPFNPRAWYWVVGADADRVYSSARGRYVSTEDEAYVAWCAAGRPTHIASEPELIDVLTQRGVSFNQGVTR